VYKGIDTSTGDVVAIKQISLAGVSQENLAGVMGEIDLLKTLNHKNIVKYIGSFKSRSHLYIILEYMENGALSSVIKPNRCAVIVCFIVCTADACSMCDATLACITCAVSTYPELRVLCLVQAPGKQTTRT
jgi:serine/threonine protein kinase